MQMRHRISVGYRDSGAPASPPLSCNGVSKGVRDHQKLIFIYYFWVCPGACMASMPMNIMMNSTRCGARDSPDPLACTYCRYRPNLTLLNITCITGLVLSNLNA